MSGDTSELRDRSSRPRKIYDPEMPVNIYELGLIYEVNVDETGQLPSG